jgi:hypothetical protein
MMMMLCHSLARLLSTAVPQILSNSQGLCTPALQVISWLICVASRRTAAESMSYCKSLALYIEAAQAMRRCLTTAGWCHVLAIP